MNNILTKPRSLNTAVLLLTFNRPDTTLRVFEAIRKAKPPRLYVSCDGPRKGREGEAERVASVQKIITNVDWPCEVKTLFQKNNLGCRYAVSTAITWFFHQEEQGIILEDDDLASLDFFYFCESLLNYYRDDERVSTITGNNFQNDKKRGDASYHFSKYFHSWGWATWRRTWNHYDGNMSFWPQWKQSADYNNLFIDNIERKYWTKIFDKNYKSNSDSMAYPFTASIWYRSGLTATPNVNLVSNIGFGEDATHTKLPLAHVDNIQIKPLGKLIHPKSVEIDVEADLYNFNYHFGGGDLRFPRSWLIFPKRALRYACRKINQLLKD